MASERVPIYRWQDGAEASVPAVEEAEGAVEVKFRFKSMYEPPLTIFLAQPGEEGGRRVAWTIRRSPLTRDSERKVASFLVGLGVEMSIFFPSLLVTNDEDASLVRYPRFVPDERFANRYAEAQALFDSGTSGTFLGVLPDVTARRPALVPRIDADAGQQMVLITIAHSGVGASGLTTPLAVDEFAKKQLLLPESSRERWERENIERGTWLIPSAEEVELYQMLGEGLPFWWGGDRFAAWLLERLAGGSP